MSEKAKKLVAITGASSGIGKAVALEFAKRGYDLIVIARRKNLLEELKKEIEGAGSTKVTAIEADLGQIDRLPALVEKLSSHHIDIFINNAGAGYRGHVLEQDPARIAGMLQVLVVALSYLTSAIGAQMAKRGGGKIVNVASIAAYTPSMPLSAVYAASKGYVRDFSLAVNFENTMLKNNVTVISVQPGAIESEFDRVAQADPTKPIKNPYQHTPAPEFAKVMVDGVEEGRTDFHYGVMANERKALSEQKTAAEYMPETYKRLMGSK